MGTSPTHPHLELGKHKLPKCQPPNNIQNKIKLLTSQKTKKGENTKHFRPETLVHPSTFLYIENMCNNCYNFTMYPCLSPCDEKA